MQQEGATLTENTPSPLGNVISIDDERIKNHLDPVVRGTVEETLNALLDAEADRLCHAQRYERGKARRDTRAGHYERNLQPKAGEVRLKVPKLRQQTFETAIIERYRRRESSVEEALTEMYDRVSVRRVEDITEALWGTPVSLEAWRNRPIEGEHPNVYLDGIVLKRSGAGEVRNVSYVTTLARTSSGIRFHQAEGRDRPAPRPPGLIMIAPSIERGSRGFRFAQRATNGQVGLFDEPERSPASPRRSISCLVLPIRRPAFFEQTVFQGQIGDNPS